MSPVVIKSPTTSGYDLRLQQWSTTLIKSMSPSSSSSSSSSNNDSSSNESGTVSVNNENADYDNAGSKSSSSTPVSLKGHIKNGYFVLKPVDNNVNVSNSKSSSSSKAETTTTGFRAKDRRTTLFNTVFSYIDDDPTNTNSSSNNNNISTNNSNSSSSSSSTGIYTDRLSKAKLSISSFVSGNAKFRYCQSLSLLSSKSY
jgi:hypothetical protein